MKNLFYLSSTDEDMFFSMTGSMMSLSTYVHSNDMESSFSSSISSCSTDTSRTGGLTDIDRDGENISRFGGLPRELYFPQVITFSQSVKR